MNVDPRRVISRTVKAAAKGKKVEEEEIVACIKHFERLFQVQFLEMITNYYRVHLTDEAIDEYLQEGKDG